MRPFLTVSSLTPKTDPMERLRLHGPTRSVSGSGGSKGEEEPSQENEGSDPKGVPEDPVAARRTEDVLVTLCATFSVAMVVGVMILVSIFS